LNYKNILSHTTRHSKILIDDIGTQNCNSQLLKK